MCIEAIHLDLPEVRFKLKKNLIYSEHFIKFAYYQRSTGLDFKKQM